MGTRHGRRLEVGALLLLLVVAAVPRLMDLEADPPLRVSAAFITDEGWWAQNARQHALFGHWVMDDHNPALYVAPVYTLALRGVYAVAGVGIWQTRLLSALAGILTCLALYAGLRAVLPTRQALPPSLFLALSLATVTLNRIAFTESLQLFLMTVAASAMLWAGRRFWWGMLAGIALALAVLCKPNALVMAPILAAFWAGEWWRERGSSQPLAARLRPLVALAAAGAVFAGLVTLVFVVPHWSAIRTQLGVSIANVYAVNTRLGDGGVLFFFIPWFGLRPTLFSSDSVVPLLGVALLAWRRIRGAGATASDSAERLMWWWFGGGLLFQALQSYQPERRFLLLMVPLIVLGSRGLLEEGVRLVAGRPREGLPRHLLAGGVAGALVGLLLLGWWVAPLTRWLAVVRIGGEPGISASTIQQFLWHGSVVGGLLLAVRLWRWAPRRGVVFRVWPWLCLWLVLEPGRLYRDLARPSYALRDGAETLADLSAQLPPDRRVVTGDLANTLALDSDLFSFLIRNDRTTGAAINLDGWERFRPSLAVSARLAGARYGNPAAAALSDFMPICTFVLRPGTEANGLLEATLWQARGVALRARCPAGSRPGR